MTRAKPKTGEQIRPGSLLRTSADRTLHSEIVKTSNSFTSALDDIHNK